MKYESARRQRTTYGRWARLYDFSTALAGRIYGFSDVEERRKAIELLALAAGHRVLEVGVGTGANLALLAQRVGDSGTIVGVDVTPAMLHICAQRCAREGIAALLIEGDAAHRPFQERSFDAVLIFGAFNGLDDRERALAETMRAAKSNAKIVITDEGMSERKRKTFLGRLFVRQDHWLKARPPLELLPASVRDAKVTHFRAENWYLIDCTNPSPSARSD